MQTMDLAACSVGRSRMTQLAEQRPRCASGHLSCRIRQRYPAGRTRCRAGELLPPPAMPHHAWRGRQGWHPHMVSASARSAANACGPIEATTQAEPPVRRPDFRAQRAAPLERDAPVHHAVRSPASKDVGTGRVRATGRRGRASTACRGLARPCLKHAGRVVHADIAQHGQWRRHGVSVTPPVRPPARS